MKKSLIAIAGIAALTAVPAMAQSSVTLFGVVDATLAFGEGSISKRTQLTNSGFNSSRLGFRGTEDLGGGMSASFWLEAGVNNDDGQGVAVNSNNQASGTGAAVAGRQGLTFNRRSTVSIASGLGELRLGRDYTPQFWNIAVFDPFGANGVGTTQTLGSIITGVTSVRASNSIGYFLPGNLGGFYGQFQYYMGENNSGTPTSSDGRGTALRLGFDNGRLNAAISVSRTKYAAGNVEQNNIGGTYNFGVAKLYGEYSWDKNGTLKGKGGLIGSLVPVGAGEIRLSYSRYRTDAVTDPAAKKFAIGYAHHLSKRTTIYATAARIKNSGASALTLNGAVTAAGGSSTGFDFGLRHSF